MMRLELEREDEGMSLVELLVTIVIFGMIGAVVATAMITTLQTSRNVSVRGDDLNAVQVASEEMSKLLRTAAVPPGLASTSSAITSASASDLTFYAYNRPGFAPSRVRFWVDSAQNLKEQIDTTANCTSPYTYTTARTRTLATNVSATAVLFTYRAAPTTVVSPTSYDGAQIATPSPAPSGSSTTAAIEQIGLNLSVDLPSSPDIPSATVQTVVFLPNHLVATESLPSAAC